MKYKPLALAAAALLAGYLGLGGGARAANVMTGAAMPDSATSQDGNIQLASHWHHHHHHGSSIFLGFGFPGFYQPYYYEPYYYEPYYYEPYYYEPYYYEPYYYGHFYYHHKRHCRHPDKVHHRCRSLYRY
jgi:hypothetical protein